MKQLTEKLGIIQSKLVAPKGQKNTFGNYNFRSCEDILNAVKPLLKETNTIILLKDDLVQIGGRYYVKATATLSDGENQIDVTSYARESESKRGMDDSQITGASSSYARKYALNGLLAIDNTKDADTMDNRHKELPKEVNESIDLKTKVIAKGKEKFKSADEFSAWRVDNGLCESISKATEKELEELYAKLNT